MKFFNAYSFQDSRASAIFFDPEVEPSKTVQSQRDEADINVIVKRFGLTGQMPQNVRPPSFQDFDGVFDFQTAINAIVDAERSFMLMPADVRSRFGNDPQVFLEYCTKVDEDGVLVNLEEMRKIGLAIPKVDDIIPPVMKVEVVNVPRGTEDNDNGQDGIRKGADRGSGSSS